MRKFDYTELRKLTTDQVVALAASRSDFVVVANKKTGSRIHRFLENENLFRRSPKSLSSRARYLRKAWVSFFLLDFLQLWITSINRGYEVSVVQTNPANYEVRFRC